MQKIVIRRFLLLATILSFFGAPLLYAQSMAINFKVGNCAIDYGKSTCVSSVSAGSKEDYLAGRLFSMSNVTRGVTTSNMFGPSTFDSGLAKYYIEAGTPASSLLGEAANTLAYGSNTFTLINNGGVVSTVTATATCAPLATWDGAKCERIQGAFVDFQVNNCTIAIGSSACPTSVFVGSINEYRNNKVYTLVNETKQSTSFGAITPNLFNQTLGKYLLPGSAFANVVNPEKFVANYLVYGENKLSLLDGDYPTGKAVATASCATGSTWNGSKCFGGGASWTNPSNLISLESATCIIPSQGNQCGAKISWNLSSATTPNFVAGKTSFTVSAFGGYDIFKDSYPATTFMNPAGENTVTYSLANNGSAFDTKKVTSKCVTGTSWDRTANNGGGACMPPAGTTVGTGVTLSGSLTLPAATVKYGSSYDLVFTASNAAECLIEAKPANSSTFKSFGYWNATTGGQKLGNWATAGREGLALGVNTYRLTCFKVGGNMGNSNGNPMSTPVTQDLTITNSDVSTGANSTPASGYETLSVPSCSLSLGASVCTSRATIANVASGKMYDLYNETTGVTTTNAFNSLNAYYFNPQYAGTAVELRSGTNILRLRGAGSTANLASVTVVVNTEGSSSTASPTIGTGTLNSSNRSIVLSGNNFGAVITASYVISNNPISVSSGAATISSRTSSSITLSSPDFGLPNVLYYKVILKTSSNQEVTYVYYSPENRAASTNTLIVTEPKEGSILTQENTYTFSWTGGKTGESYNVYLSDGVSPLGSPLNAMLIQVSGTSGSESFRVNRALPSGGNYRIKFVKVGKNERIYGDSIDSESKLFTVGSTASQVPGTSNGSFLPTGSLIIPTTIKMGSKYGLSFTSTNAAECLIEAKAGNSDTYKQMGYWNATTGGQSFASSWATAGSEDGFIAGTNYYRITCFKNGGSAGYANGNVASTPVVKEIALTNEDITSSSPTGTLTVPSTVTLGSKYGLSFTSTNAAECLIEAKPAGSDVYKQMGYWNATTGGQSFASSWATAGSEDSFKVGVNTHKLTCFKNGGSIGYANANGSSLPVVKEVRVTSTSSDTSAGLISLSSSTCTIPAQGNQCGSKISWSLSGANTPNFVAGKTVFHVSAFGGYDIFKDSYVSTTFMNSAGENTATYTLSNNGVLLDTKTVTSKCVSGTSWDGNKCQSMATTSPVSPTNRCGSSSLFYWNGLTCKYVVACSSYSISDCSNPCAKGYTKGSDDNCVPKSGTITPSPLPQPLPPTPAASTAPILEIKQSDILIRGTVQAVEDNVFKLKSLGGVWTIKITSDTLYSTALSNSGSRQNLSQGDFVGVQGTISSDSDFTVIASSVRNRTLYP